MSHDNDNSQDSNPKNSGARQTGSVGEQVSNERFPDDEVQDKDLGMLFELDAKRVASDNLIPQSIDDAILSAALSQSSPNTTKDAAPRLVESKPATTPSPDDQVSSNSPTHDNTAQVIELDQQQSRKSGAKIWQQVFAVAAVLVLAVMVIPLLDNSAEQNSSTPLASSPADTVAEVSSDDTSVSSKSKPHTSTRADSNVGALLNSEDTDAVADSIDDEVGLVSRQSAVGGGAGDSQVLLESEELSGLMAEPSAEAPAAPAATADSVVEESPSLATAPQALAQESASTVDSDALTSSLVVKSRALLQSGNLSRDKLSKRESTADSFALNEQASPGYRENPQRWWSEIQRMVEYQQLQRANTEYQLLKKQFTDFKPDFPETWPSSWRSLWPADIGGEVGGEQ